MVDAPPGEEYLEIRAPDGVTRRVTLSPDSPTLLGRAVGAHVLLESTAVSRQHAEIARDPASGRWRLRDLGSRNGTLVNGLAVRDHLLAPGDIIRIGSFDLALIDPAALNGDGPPATYSSGTNLLLSDDATGRISTLKDLEPPRVSAGHLTTLNDLSRDLLAADQPHDRALLLCSLLVSPQFLGEWAMLLRLDKADPDAPPHPLSDPQRAARPRGPGPAAAADAMPPPVSRTLLRAVARHGEPALASNVQSAQSLPSNVEMSIAPGVMAMAAVACPTRGDDATLDVLYVTLPPQCGTGEWLALATLAGKQYQQAEQAWAARARAADHAALERELGQARQIQLRLVPKPAALAPLRDRGVDVAVGFEPSRYVGGDYVDALTLRDGRVLLVLGDVCGHGLAAALVTSAVHTLVHAAVRAGADLRQLVDGLGHHLRETLGGDSFVTFVAVALDPATGAIECLNAGHPAPLVVAADGTPRSLRVGGNLPLGLVADGEFDDDELEVETAQLAPGEILMIFSDGLSEQPDAAGKMLGIAGLRSRFQELCAAAPPAAPAQALAAELSNFLSARQAGRPPEDDQSFLLARRI
jgi:serine phosphatase RsbU (regulator of sigma subunit)